MDFFNFDEFFNDFEFDRDFIKRMRRAINKLEKGITNGEMKGNWDVREINEPNVKGYIIQGHFSSGDPKIPLEPIEPIKPLRREPRPMRPIGFQENEREDERGDDETREPLTDIFEEGNDLKVYMELPGEEKDDIKLNLTEGKVEIKSKNFYKIVDLPTRFVNIEKASSIYKNGVLTITIPKKERRDGDE